MVTNVTDLTSVRPLIERNGTASQEMRTWAQAITTQTTITGEGSPEGVVQGEITAEYMDLNGTTGTLLYRKRDADILGDKTKGWVLV